MLPRLKDHPFAVEAFFESSIVFTFAFEKEQIIHLLPPCLEPDTLNDKYAFVAIAMVQTKNLRPKGFPKMFGNDFFLIGYRIFVRYTNNAGKRLRGLYILRSETDKKKMQLLGNIFTHYNYTTTDISLANLNGTLQISSQKSSFHIAIEKPANNIIPLPAGSPFTEWKEARRFAGPLPFTFTFNERKNEVLIIEGVRENWQPSPVKVLNYHFSFFETLNLQGGTLASAFIIQNIPYYWKKGKIEKWKS